MVDGRSERANLVWAGGVSSFTSTPEVSTLLESYGLEVIEAVGPRERERVVAIVWGDRPFGVAEATEFPRLKVLARFGTGTDAVDVAELRRLGIVVERTPGVSTGTVAEFALAMIIMTLRRLGPHVEGLRREQSSWRPEARGRDVIGSATVGILGCGRIGLETARLLERLGVSTIAWNRSWPPDPHRGPVPGDLHCVERLEELATRADVVSVHVALEPETEGLVSTRFFRAAEEAGRSLALVNTARGAVVDDEALLKALDRRTVFAAAIDVWSTEGDGPAPPIVRRLRCHPRVMPTPHIAAHTIEVAHRCAVECARRIVAQLVGSAGAVAGSADPRVRRV